MKLPATALLALALAWPAAVRAEATLVNTPYTAPKVVYDFFLDDPAKMGAALYWIRSLILPLSVPPY